jgi:hypothetical protein
MKTTTPSQVLVMMKYSFRTNNQIIQAIAVDIACGGD